MRLVDPVRGFVVETTDPHTIAILLYGRGYWDADADQWRADSDVVQSGQSPSDSADIE